MMGLSSLIIVENNFVDQALLTALRSDYRLVRLVKSEDKPVGPFKAYEQIDNLKSDALYEGPIGTPKFLFELRDKLLFGMLYPASQCNLLIFGGKSHWITVQYHVLRKLVRGGGRIFLSESHHGTEADNFLRYINCTASETVLTLHDNVSLCGIRVRQLKLIPR